MRFSRIVITNYKGIARAELDDLSNQSVVTISGRNGTGKSLLLEAVVGEWTGRYDMRERVGPWSDELCIELETTLTDDEWTLVDAWHERTNQPKPSRGPLFHRRRTRRLSGDEIEEDTVTSVLRNNIFQREHPFSIVDFLPANRLVPNTQKASVDLTMLDVEKVHQERHQMMDSFINQRSPMSLPSVSSYLVTLDYQNLLANRQDLQVDDDYGILQTAFGSATGKQLLLPQYDPGRGSNVEIQVPSGHNHGLKDLSSGEQEMLAMMFFVRRLSASGGILCIDEPEQHLHPTLQAALFDAMSNLAERSQILVVSHSVNLIAASPVSGLAQVDPPIDVNTNQVQRLKDNPGKSDLVAELGITPADLFQSDMLLVVEGDTDAQWLRLLFPVEIGKAHMIVAGSADQVMRTMSSLGSIPAGLPWLCLRDRDMMTNERRSQLLADNPNLHIWPRRAIESMLLDAPLIQATAEALGLTVTTAEVDAWMLDAAAPLQDEVLEGLVRTELSRREPPPAADNLSGLERFARLEQYLQDYAAVNTRRAAMVTALVAEQRAELQEKWAKEWKAVVNPKAVLAKLVPKIGKLRSAADLESALFTRARLDASLRPAALEDFRLRLLSTSAR